MAIEEKFVHPVSRNDMVFYKKLCRGNSFHFSDSEAYLDSYIISKSLFCYNDQRTIFFFGKFLGNTLFLCCPKGENIREKTVQFLLFASRRYGFKKFWLFEVPGIFICQNFKKIGIKNIQQVEMKRPVLFLKKFEILSSFLIKNKKLREKWNQFSNALKREERETEILLKKLTLQNLSDAQKIATVWHIRIREKASESFLSPEIILKKNIILLNNAISRPEFYECYILYCNGNPRGVRAAFKIGNSSNIGASILCTDRVIPQTATVINLLFFQLMANNGYNLINLGNSYTCSIEEFKFQFQPDKYDTAYEYHLSF